MQCSSVDVGDEGGNERRIRRCVHRERYCSIRKIVAAQLIVMLLSFALSSSAAAEVELKPFAKLYASLDVYGDWSPGSDHTPSLRNGGMSPSYLGLRAGVTFTEYESLTLNVESLVNLVDFSWTKQGIGDRRASGTLQTRWGALSAGRQFTPHLWFMVRSEERRVG